MLGAGRSLFAHRAVAALAVLNVRSFAAGAAPRKIFALQYSYVDGMLEKRTPHREEHLKLLSALSSDGRCLLGGAFLEPCDGAVIIFATAKDAEEFVRADPYNKAGLIASYKVRDYMAVTGSLLKDDA